jgi:flagellar biosynthesis/type III secretory pathway protein FliH
MRVERRAGQMAELLKFFTEDFDAAYADAVVAAAPEPPAEPLLTALDLEVVREAGYQDGLRDGLQQAAAARDAVVERTIAALEEQLRSAQYQAAQEADRAATSVARVLIQFLMKMLPALCARYGAEEIAEVARAVLPGLHQEPHVVVAVNPEFALEVEAELERQGADMKQRAVLTPTDSVAPGDVRISWRDGWAARDTNDLLQRISAVFASHGLLDTGGANAAVI